MYQCKTDQAKATEQLIFWFFHDNEIASIQRPHIHKHLYLQVTRPY